MACKFLHATELRSARPHYKWRYPSITTIGMTRMEHATRIVVSRCYRATTERSTRTKTISKIKSEQHSGSFFAIRACAFAGPRTGAVAPFSVRFHIWERRMPYSKTRRFSEERHP